MFWTETLAQLTLFGGVEYESSSTVSELIRFAEDAFPECDSNFHRHVAFLTHEATQRFLRPMIVSTYGTLDSAKMPTLEWLESLGSLETFARSTRAKEGVTKPASLRKCTTPDWYIKYHTTDHYSQVKAQAEEFWRSYMGSPHCSVNARHEYQVLHHSDYGRMGEADEFRYLVPLCNDCHASVSARGPRIPASLPEGVKQWL
jgi:hypothetical protein